MKKFQVMGSIYVLTAILLLSLSTSIFAAESLVLSQCSNLLKNVPRSCSGAGWVRGNVGKKTGRYFEGDSVPYRIVFSGLTVGSTNVVTLQWDTTEGGRHAFDYLTSFDRTETLAMGNNPCSGVPGCSLGTFTTFPIPSDPNVAASNVTQIPGVFTFFGSTITGVSGYTLIGTYDGRSSTSISITFTADQENVVLAWSSHIAAEADWGLDESVIGISGSPYHMRIYEFSGRSPGNQDLSLGGVLNSFD